MSKKHRWLRILATLFAFSLVAAACGSSDDDTTTDDSGGESDASTDEG
ncbi:MAG: BMP family ABC transporter substrate-binding protein, partial [Actinomycetia bacterium]|nr:BMP family ABC transporter substrate-binding protein [Actinomycetes bacterium]